MNQPPSHLKISVPFTGTLIITSEVLQQLVAKFHADLPNTVRSQAIDRFSEHPERLAFTIRETAKILGVSYHTVYRLVQRRLIRCSNALRTKLIPKREIERVLEKTMDSA